MCFFLLKFGSLIKNTITDDFGIEDRFFEYFSMSLIKLFESLIKKN